MRFYYGSKISPNMVRTPEEFLICYNVPIARTGVQEYYGYELGLEDRRNELIKVYRPESEVFKPAAMASFEGKPFTDDHPVEDVTPDNFGVYGKGTVTNVRRGTGNDINLLLADIIVYNKRQIEEIESKQKREISCGYECDYVPYEDGYMQKNIVGNHVALVDAGRAGSKVAIKDKFTTQKGQEKMSEEKKSFKIPRRAKSASDYLKAVGLKVVAKDAEPEEILDAVEELIEEGREENAPEEVKEEIKEEIKEEAAGDECKMIDAEEFRSAIKEIKDAISELQAANMPTETGTESLDELVEELINTEDEDPDEEESEESEVIEIEEKAEDEDPDEESMQVSDHAIELVRALKPIIASVPDKNKRKKMSDNLSKVIKKQIKESKKEKKPNVYGNLVNSRNKSIDNRRVDDKDIGMMIAKKYNPHYKEDK